MCIMYIYIYIYIYIYTHVLTKTDIGDAPAAGVRLRAGRRHPRHQLQLLTTSYNS